MNVIDLATGEPIAEGLQPGAAGRNATIDECQAWLREQANVIEKSADYAPGFRSDYFVVAESYRSAATALEAMKS